MSAYFPHTSIGKFLLMMVSATVLCISVSAANKEKILYNFTGGSDGGDPATALVFDEAGNAYGTTVVGGTGYGTVFKLSPTKNGGWKETVLYSFTGGSDG